MAASIAALFAQAQQHHQRGQAAAAERLYRDLLQRQPGHAEARHGLGLLRAQQGAYVEAARLFQEAIAGNPRQPYFYVNLGEARRRLGELELAIAAYRQALALQPELPEAHYNLANVYREQGQLDLAVSHYQQAVRWKPNYAQAWYNLGNALRQQGRYRSAIEAYETTLRLNPLQADAHNNLAATLKEFDQLTEAQRHYQLAVWLKPDHQDALRNLAALHETLGQLEDAREYYERLLALTPDRRELWLIKETLCPLIPFSNFEIDAYRAQVLAVLDELIAEGFRPDVLGKHHWGFYPPTVLAYQGRDDKPLKQRYADLFRPSLPAFEPPPTAGKPHIGFVVTAGHEGVFLKCLRGLINHLSTETFAITVVCNLPNGEAIIRPALTNPAIRCLGLPAELPAAIERMRQARFDLLYYWECGTDSLNYFLPYCRLARVQCNGWGWPVTGGAPAMDYFLSMAGVETPESDAYYSERLIRLDHLSTYYYRPPAPAPRARADFGLPERVPLYLCCQNLRKVHPDYDRLAAGVLRADPSGLLLIIGDKKPAVTSRLRQRLQALHPDVAGRIRFLPNMAEADYLSVVTLADVILDTVHYSGGANTSYDAFACGTPVVTLPTRFHRGRYTYAAYQEIGLLDAIAQDEADYVRLAVSFGTDPDRRQAFRRQLLEACPPLFENRQAVTELSECLQTLLWSAE